MEIIPLLRGVAVFDALDENELHNIASICREATYRRGDALTTQGSNGSEVFLVQEGLVEVSVDESSDRPVSMGVGQIVGEMSLIDRGPRSATVRCITGSCRVIVIERSDFEALCEANHHIGMIVYRNLAAELSFKLRHRHLAHR